MLSTTIPRKYPHVTFFFQTMGRKRNLGPTHEAKLWMPSTNLIGKHWVDVTLSILHWMQRYKSDAPVQQSIKNAVAHHPPIDPNWLLHQFDLAVQHPIWNNIYIIPAIQGHL